MGARLMFFFLLFLGLMSCQQKCNHHGLSEVKNVKIDSLTRNRMEQMDKSIGVLVLSSNYKGELISIFNVDGSLWQSFRYIDTFSDNKISPLAFKPENALLVFKCLGKIDGFYKIIASENGKEIKLIKIQDANFQFQTWEQHLPTLFSVDFDINENPLRVEPNDTARSLPFNQENFYHPVKTEGDWLMLRHDDGTEGWVKWRDGNGDLLLELYYES